MTRERGGIYRRTDRQTDWLTDRVTVMEMEAETETETVRVRRRERGGERV